MDSNQYETQSKDAFRRLRETELEPSPFMQTRIMARLKDHGGARREIVFWRWLSGLTMAACAVLAWVHFSAAPGIDGSKAIAMQPYVIHVDFGDTRPTGATIAEIELPEGVEFVSKAHPEVAKMRSMRMELPEQVEGRSRMPFVVSAAKSGRQDLKLRILNEKDEVIQERIVSVTFTGKSASVL